MQEMQAKPPYVTFEARAVEDRDATIAAGHYVGKDVNYALITPAGSKDRIEKVAEDWLRDTRQAVQEDRFPMEWLRHYEAIYKDWTEGREIPENGTPILTWPLLSKSQVEACLNMNIRTIEHLADANESTLNGIGMGGRALKEKAKAYLQTANDVGKTASELDELRTKVTSLESQVESLTAANRTLSSENESLKN